MAKRRGAAEVMSETEEGKKPKSGYLAFSGETPEVDYSAVTVESRSISVERKFKFDPKKAEPIEEPAYTQIIISGNPGCGKTSLVLSFLQEPLPPSNMDYISKQYLHVPKGKNYGVMIWDLDSGTDFDEYRRESYQEADIMLLCFDIQVAANLLQANNRLDNLFEPWLAELNENNRNVPVILVALKEDLIEAESYPERERVTREEIGRIRERHPEIISYREVSAHAERGVDELFAEALDSILMPTAKAMFATCGFVLGKLS